MGLPAASAVVAREACARCPPSAPSCAWLPRYRRPGCMALLGGMCLVRQKIDTWSDRRRRTRSSGWVHIASAHQRRGPLRAPRRCSQRSAGRPRSRPYRPRPQKRPDRGSLSFSISSSTRITFSMPSTRHAVLGAYRRRLAAAAGPAHAIGGGTEPACVRVHRGLDLHAGWTAGRRSPAWRSPRPPAEVSWPMGLRMAVTLAGAGRDEKAARPPPAPRRARGRTRAPGDHGGHLHGLAARPTICGISSGKRTWISRTMAGQRRRDQRPVAVGPHAAHAAPGWRG